MIKVVDLFCGAGGLTHGMERAGFDVVAGYDIEKSCRYAYEKNNKSVFINKSVLDISADEMLSHYKGASFKVLAGCAPCQPFSTYSNSSKNNNKGDDRWTLLYSFGEHIRKIKPDIVTMENVPGLIKHKVFIDFITSLEQQSYSVWYGVVYCPDYGMAQTRSRLVLLASKLGDISIIEPTHKPENYTTLRNVIGKLPKIEAGEQHLKDKLHKASSLSDLNMKRMIASKPGGTWRDWPKELIADCHKKESGGTYSSVYGRMEYEKPAPTITTQCIGFGNGRFGHPEQNRAMTLREAAMLQSFPKNYKFWPSKSKVEMRAIARMIGNAVPVRLGEVVAESIKLHLSNKT